MSNDNKEEIDIELAKSIEKLVEEETNVAKAADVYKRQECIMVTVNIKNMSEEKQRVTLEGFTLTSQAWTTCTAPGKYMACLLYTSRCV